MVGKSRHRGVRGEGLSGLEGQLAVVGLQVTTNGFRTGTGTERWRERIPYFRGRYRLTQVVVEKKPLNGCSSGSSWSVDVSDAVVAASEYGQRVDDGVDPSVLPADVRHRVPASQRRAFTTPAHQATDRTGTHPALRRATYTLSRLTLQLVYHTDRLPVNVHRWVPASQCRAFRSTDPIPTHRAAIYIVCHLELSSVLWRCWLGCRKGIRSEKTEWWGAGMVICLERGADLHTAQLMPLPLTVSCFSKFQIGFTFLVPAHPDSPRQRAVKRVCVSMWILTRHVDSLAKYCRLFNQQLSPVYRTARPLLWTTQWTWCSCRNLFCLFQLFYYIVLQSQAVIFVHAQYKFLGCRW